MHLTRTLYARHIGRHIEKKWHIEGRMKVEISRAEEFLTKNNIKVYQPEDLDPPRPIQIKEVNHLIPPEITMDRTNPDWNDQPCFIYGDNDVLLQGLDQAKEFTNCEEIPHLPDKLIKMENDLILPNEFHAEARRKIMQCCIFDAVQEKLPKRKDPERPAFVFPRDYGITDVRKNKLLLKNLVQLCEENMYCSDKSVVENAFFASPMEVYNKKIQFQVTGDLVVRSEGALSNFTDTDNEKIGVPNLHPVDCTVTLKPYNIYRFQNIFPFQSTSRFPYVHTALITFNRTQVTNIYEESVTVSQMIGRNLLKGFGLGAAQAFSNFGLDIKTLIKPIVVQIIMTDGKLFHFSVLQLNTMDIENKTSVRNLYWNSDPVSLYSTCEYVSGRPVLQDYNEQVLRRLIAFYKNI